jgi:hypothetical protein
MFDLRPSIPERTAQPESLPPCDSLIRFPFRLASGHNHEFTVLHVRVYVYSVLSADHLCHVMRRHACDAPFPCSVCSNGSLQLDCPTLMERHLLTGLTLWI